MVGWSYNLPPDFVDPATNPFNSFPFLWQGGVMTALPMPGMTNGFAGAINASGLIAGNAFDGATFHAMVWRQDQTGAYVPLDLGFPMGTFRSSFRGVNNQGDVVGDARLIGGPGHAFWWRPDGHGGYVARDLGTLGGFGSAALDINNRDQIVGRSRSPGGAQHAFLYDSTGIHDLNGLIPSGSGWVLDTARSINDRGQIVGVGIHNGEFHGFLLTPTPAVATRFFSIAADGSFTSGPFVGTSAATDSRHRRQDRDDLFPRVSQPEPPSVIAAEEVSGPGRSRVPDGTWRIDVALGRRELLSTDRIWDEWRDGRR